MKLRNKNTGEICELVGFKISNESFKEKFGEKDYYSLQEFCDVWEDYEPVEPLIKDKKIRKAVRAWAEASDIEAVYLNSEALCWIEGFARIEFAGDQEWYKELEEGKRYTITELCGEEEE